MGSWTATAVLVLVAVTLGADAFRLPSHEVLRASSPFTLPASLCGRTQRNKVLAVQMAEKGLAANEEEEHVRPVLERSGRSTVSSLKRRNLVMSGLLLGACGCCVYSSPADAMTQLRSPPEELLKKYDLPRDGFLDAAFACGMSTGMGDYEEAAKPKKKQIFKEFLSAMPRTDATIVEVGMGSFPNAPYFGLLKEAPKQMDIIGVDPNDKMASYAQKNARRAKLLNGAKDFNDPLDTAVPNGNRLRIVHGVSEALPFDDASVDGVVCSLTLCSVVDPARSVAEIKRILKPGGKFLFWEHVLSQTDPDLARQQVALTPNQVKRADGCHLDRSTGETIKQAGFAEDGVEYLELSGFGFLNPTVAGIARA